MSGYPIPRKKNPGYPEKINPDPQDFRDFLEIFSGFSNPNPDTRNFVIFGILRSGFFGIFRGFKIPIPIPGILGFSGFFDLAQNKKSHPEAKSVPYIGCTIFNFKKSVLILFVAPIPHTAKFTMLHHS